MRTPLLLAGLALAVAGLPLAAQESDNLYMGIDLAAETEVGPETRALDIELRGLLDEGVELGCLAFEPPLTFSQIANDSAECREYMPRLIAMTEDNTEAEASDETLAEAQANTMRAIPLVQLARAAQAGNKRAQLELGMRFEEGIGVEQNWENALELYRQAGRATPARRGIGASRVSEPGESGGIGRRELSPRIPGLREARERRDALMERMQDQ